MIASRCVDILRIHVMKFFGTHKALSPQALHFGMWMRLVEDSGLQHLTVSGGTEALTETRRYRRTVSLRRGGLAEEEGTERRLGHLETVTATVIGNGKVLVPRCVGTERFDQAKRTA